MRALLSTVWGYKRPVHETHIAVVKKGASRGSENCLAKQKLKQVKKVKKLFRNLADGLDGGRRGLLPRKKKLPPRKVMERACGQGNKWGRKPQWNKGRENPKTRASLRVRTQAVRIDSGGMKGGQAKQGGSPEDKLPAEKKRRGPGVETHAKSAVTAKVVERAKRKGQPNFSPKKILLRQRRCTRQPPGGGGHTGGVRLLTKKNRGVART